MTTRVPEVLKPLETLWLRTPARGGEAVSGKPQQPQTTDRGASVEE
jgi:hypothetical protein